MSDSKLKNSDSAAPPQTARAVIVGGGIMGCALAYHLGKLGWRDLVLLEKGELTSGSTWHAAGQITRATSHRALGECVDYGIKLYKNLQNETGQSATFHGCGSLRVAYDEDEADWLRHILSVCAGADFPAEIVPPARIRQLHPFFNTDGILCALHTPDDGHLDPAGATFALAKGAKMHGVQIVRHCRATNVQKTASGEWRVQTTKGDIVCEHFVNAGGVYARQIALWNGYDLPATSMTHHYFVTGLVAEFDSLAAELPVVRDDKNISGYARMEQKSGLIGIYEKENPNTVWNDGAPWEAEHELFTPDYARVEKYLAAAMERMPVLERAGIRRAVHGAISHPPDGMPLIGPAPGLRNYWCCCGCQIGIGWGPGLALQLALWMQNGAADIGMREFDPRRFGGWANREYQIAKAKEDYVLRHEIPFPHFNRLAARPKGESALYERLLQKGAVYEEVGGRERPRWFAANGILPRDIYSFRRSALHNLIGAEVTAVREGAGLCDISSFAKAMVCGKEAAAFLDLQTCAPLPNVRRARLAHFLSANGRIDFESTIWRVDENRFYIVCAAFFQRRMLDLLQFRRAKFGGDVQVQDLSLQWDALAMNGPKSRRALAAVAPQTAAMQWLDAAEVSFGGEQILVCRMSYAGEFGFEFHGPPAAIAALYDSLCEEEPTARDYGSFAMNAMRMEKMFRGASELTNEITLSEAGVEHFADWQKPDFVGREAALAARDSQKWRCVYLRIAEDEKNDGAGGEAVWDARGERTGAISSIAFGHSVGALLAFAFVRLPDAAAATKLQVVINGQPRPAEVLDKAIYDPQNIRPRS